jgi:hypothetical protein
MHELTETPPASPSPLSLIPPPPPASTENKPLKLQREEARKSEQSTPDRWHDIFI